MKLEVGQKVNINPYMSRVFKGKIFLVNSDHAFVDVPGFQKYVDGRFIPKTHRFKIDLNGKVIDKELLGQELPD